MLSRRISSKTSNASGQFLKLFAFTLLTTAGLPSGWAQVDPGTKKAAKDAIQITDASREDTPNDFLRVTFVSAGTPVTTLNRPGSLRAFATATTFYEPPLALKEFPLYSGLVNDDSKTLVAMRCQPPQREITDAVLATWPNVFAAIQRDLGIDPAKCEAPAGDDDTRAFCFAHSYKNEAGDNVPISLAHSMSYAATAFEAYSPLAAWLKNKYGIFPAFSGLGFSVKDSYYLDAQHPMSTQQILAKSISPEYVLKNVSLKDAGCRCISVAPYEGRANDPLDPEFVWSAGGDGECKAVSKLETAK